MRQGLGLFFIRNRAKAGLPQAVNLNLLIEHGCWPHPQTLVAVKGSVKRHRLQGFAVAHGVNHLIQPALVMPVVAGAGGDEWL